MNILITGGAGYIGSHVVKMLGERGYNLTIIDNLSKGHREAILYGRLIEADLREERIVLNILKDTLPEAIIHFAGSILVGESYKNPLKYYHNNLVSTISLLNAMVKRGIKYIIFSSSASIYGIAKDMPIKEEERPFPINPYGKTKLFVEEMLSDLDKSHGIRYISLRYFNAAGADESGLIGEMHSPETHLIPRILKVAQGKKNYITIYGTNYPTPDGTCIRDYIHVNDLAEAHILTLKYLLEKKESRVYNLGNERGYSVKEVINTAEKVTKMGIKIKEGPPREGEPPILIASSKKIKKELFWQPKREDLSYIINSAWNFILKSNNFYET